MGLEADSIGTKYARQERGVTYTLDQGPTKEWDWLGSSYQGIPAGSPEERFFLMTKHSQRGAADYIAAWALASLLLCFSSSFTGGASRSLPQAKPHKQNRLRFRYAFALSLGCFSSTEFTWHTYHR